MIQGRVKLVSLDRRIESSYSYGKTGRPIPAYMIKPMCMVAPWIADWVLELWEAVRAEGGTLRLTDCHRHPNDSAVGRAKYDRWQFDKKRGVKYDSSIHKKAYVKHSGTSWHNPGYAIDIGIKLLNFDVPYNRWVDIMQEISIPIGWLPIVHDTDGDGDIDEDALEAWHFERLPPWLAKLGMERGDEAVMAACLDLGLYEEYFGRGLEAKALQTQIWRCGINIGAIDGRIGTKTCKGLQALGLSANERDYTKLFSLPDKVAGEPI